MSHHLCDVGDLVDILDSNGNIFNIAIYLGQKKINGFHHLILMTDKGIKNLDSMYYSIIKKEF